MPHLFIWIRQTSYVSLYRGRSKGFLGKIRPLCSTEGEGFESVMKAHRRCEADFGLRRDIAAYHLCKLCLLQRGMSLCPCRSVSLWSKWRQLQTLWWMPSLGRGQRRPPVAPDGLHVIIRNGIRFLKPLLTSAKWGHEKTSDSMSVAIRNESLYLIPPS